MEVMADVSAALDFSHRHGIVHRDVKPANVMITKSGAVKVMDFGIARALHDGQAAVTQTAAVIGTAQYLSPEQARGESVDARSDVYAAGCVLFELLTGEPPFTGDSPVAVAYQHVREDPKAPSQLNPKVSPQLDAIVLKAMSKGPANRYQSAAEMRADLVRVLSGQRPSAPAVMTAEDRTAVMNEQASPRSQRTQVVNGGGRHRPAALKSEPDDDYDPIADEEEERRAKRKKAIMITLVVVLCVAVLGLAAWITTSLMNTGSEATEKVGRAVHRRHGPVDGLGQGHAGGPRSPSRSSSPVSPARTAPPRPCTSEQIIEGDPAPTRSRAPRCSRARRSSSRSARRPVRPAHRT